jgi:hydroxyacylglutathione hydrolase
MLLKYFYNEKVAHASYMVGCQATGDALIVDPGRDIDQYLAEAERQELRITAVTETHIHADFVSGARELADRVGAKLYLSDEGDENWKYEYLDAYQHQLLCDGDVFMVGNIKLEVLHTPGHTPEHISFLLTDTAGADEPMGLFTGDFVFVGSIGRPDLLEEAAGMQDTAVIGAKQMFRSVQRLKELPDYLQIWPAHGAGSACGKGLGAIPSSTLGYEKLFNPMLRFGDDQEQAFVETLLADQPEAPFYFAVMKRVNKEGPAVLGASFGVPHLAAESLPDILASDATIIDTRSTDSFAYQHLQGTINIPLESLPQWAGWLVEYTRPCYLMIDAQHAQEAIRDLFYIGLDQIGGIFSLEALAMYPHLHQSYKVASASELADRVMSGQVTVIDVRAKTEWDEGHIPVAEHIMLGYLGREAQEILNGQEQAIVLHCRSGNRSAIGASILQKMGADDVINMAGGFTEWVSAGLPVEMG